MALNKPDVCEAKHAYKNITKYKKACKLKRAEGIALNKPDVFEAKHACKNITENKKACKSKGVEGIALHKPNVCEAKHAYNFKNHTESRQKSVQNKGS